VSAYHSPVPKYTVGGLVGFAVGLGVGGAVGFGVGFGVGGAVGFGVGAGVVVAAAKPTEITAAARANLLLKRVMMITMS
jgi:hypothetical protein